MARSLTTALEKKIFERQLYNFVAGMVLKFELGAVGYGRIARSFDHHPIAKPERRKIATYI